MKSIHEVSSFPQVRLKYLVNRIPGGTPDSRREEFWSDGTIPWISISDMSNRHSVGETAKKITPEARQKAGLEIGPAGTVLFAMYASVGEVAVTEIDAVWNQALIGLVPKSQRLSPSFLHYYLLAVRPYLPALYRSNTQNNLNAEQVENLRLPLPPRSQQEEIVAFLDRETAEIDAFIADQERLIELLEERRAATITHTVTKGLDPTVPMKDSGVKWLGEVPRHWGIRKLKSFVATPITDGPHETPELVSEGVPFVSAEAVSSGVLDFKNIRGYISLEDHRRFSRKYSPQRGDIYMIKSGATTGRCALVDTDADFSIWSPLAVIRCDDTASPRFVLHALRSANFQESVRLFWNYGTQQNIGMKVLENLPIPFPDIAEQHELAAYLDGEVAELDAAVADAREAIALSRERRAALISAAVTGQLDVSQAQSRRSVGEVLESGVRV